MKQLLIALIALTMTLGVACKKQEVKSEQPLKVKKASIIAPAVEHNSSCPSQQNPDKPGSGYGPCNGCPKSGG